MRVLGMVRSDLHCIIDDHLGLAETVGEPLLESRPRGVLAPPRRVAARFGERHLSECVEARSLCNELAGLLREIGSVAVK